MNKNAIPNDPQKPAITSGIRIGTPALTTRCFGEAECAEVANLIADLLEQMNIVLWSVFFLVPVGRGLAEQRIAPEQYEEVFEKLWQNAQRRPFGIKTTEAHHYRRYVLLRNGDPQQHPGGPPPWRG